MSFAFPHLQYNPNHFPRDKEKGRLTLNHFPRVEEKGHSHKEKGVSLKENGLFLKELVPSKTPIFRNPREFHGNSVLFHRKSAR